MELALFLDAHFIEIINVFFALDKAIKVVLLKTTFHTGDMHARLYLQA